jgi:hypothetical protein
VDVINPADVRSSAHGQKLRKSWIVMWA